ncbi:MAG: SH3 domain-containing protein [Thermodesulfobacteriota bacterium]
MPDFGSPVIGSASVDDHVTVLAVQENWVSVRRQNIEGWIHEYAFMDYARRSAQEQQPIISPQLSPSEEFEQNVNIVVDYLTNNPSW